jgi:hypothetical protein
VTTVERVMAIVAAEVGYVEGQGWTGGGSAPNNWTIYGAELDQMLIDGTLIDPGMGPWRRAGEWCATFERWCLMKAGILDLEVPNLHLYTVLFDLSAVRNAGEGVAATELRRGDIWMMGQTQAESHTGWVEIANTDGTYDTIEGNLGKGVRRNVRRHQELRGGWRPHYTAAAVVIPPSPEPGDIVMQLAQIPGRSAILAYSGDGRIVHVRSPEALNDGRDKGVWGDWDSIVPITLDLAETFNGGMLVGGMAT